MKEEQLEKRRQLFADILKSEFTPQEQGQIAIVEREFSIYPVGPEDLKLRFSQAMVKRMGEMLDELKKRA